MCGALSGAERCEEQLVRSKSYDISSTSSSPRTAGYIFPPNFLRIAFVFLRVSVIKRLHLPQYDTAKSSCKVTCILLCFAMHVNPIWRHACHGTNTMEGGCLPKCFPHHVFGGHCRTPDMHLENATLENQNIYRAQKLERRHQFPAVTQLAFHRTLYLTNLF